VGGVIELLLFLSFVTGLIDMVTLDSSLTPCTCNWGLLGALIRGSAFIVDVEEFEEFDEFEAIPLEVGYFES